VSVDILRVAAEATWPLRQQVLRPHQTIDQMAFPDDHDADTGHYAAVEKGEMIGTARVSRQPAPWAPEREPSWRLRGMATAEGHRSQGIGAALLAAVVGHVRAGGGGLLWCHARVPALSFYLRAGFTPHGESWVEPFIGPHQAMELEVEGSR
jgi:GNAT superfamily N-acetyltransferase